MPIPARALSGELQTNILGTRYGFRQGGTSPSDNDTPWGQQPLGYGAEYPVFNADGTKITVVSTYSTWNKRYNDYLTNKVQWWFSEYSLEVPYDLASKKTTLLKPTKKHESPSSFNAELVAAGFPNSFGYWAEHEDDEGIKSAEWIKNGTELGIFFSIGTYLDDSYHPGYVRFAASTPYDPSTLSLISNSWVESILTHLIGGNTFDNTTMGFRWADSGNSLYFVFGGSFIKANCPTAYDPSSVVIDPQRMFQNQAGWTPSGTKDYGGQNWVDVDYPAPNKLLISYNVGTYSSPNRLVLFNLGTNYDWNSVTSYTEVDNTHASTILSTGDDYFIMNSTGTKLLSWPTSTNPTIRQFNLSTPWNLTTLSLSGNTYVVNNTGSGNWTGQAHAYSHDKTKLHFFANHTGTSQSARQLSLTAACDLSVAPTDTQHTLWNRVSAYRGWDGSGTNSLQSTIYACSNWNSTGTSLYFDFYDCTWKVDFTTPYDLSTYVSGSAQHAGGAYSFITNWHWLEWGMKVAFRIRPDGNAIIGSPYTYQSAGDTTNFGLKVVQIPMDTTDDWGSTINNWHVTANSQSTLLDSDNFWPIPIFDENQLDVIYLGTGSFYSGQGWGDLAAAPNNLGPGGTNYNADSRYWDYWPCAFKRFSTPGNLTSETPDKGLKYNIQYWVPFGNMEDGSGLGNNSFVPKGSRYIVMKNYGNWTSIPFYNDVADFAEKYPSEVWKTDPDIYSDSGDVFYDIGWTGSTQGESLGNWFNSDGTKLMYGYATIYLSRPYDMSSATSFYNATLTFGANWFASKEGFTIKPDGTKVYYIDSFFGTNNRTLVQRTLSTPFDWATAGPATAAANLTDNLQGDSGLNNIHFKSDGTKMYFISPLTDHFNQWVSDNHGTRRELFQVRKAREYTLSTPWDITTIATSNYNTSTTVAASSHGISSWKWLQYSPDGTAIFRWGPNTTSGNTIVRYNLTTPWDISTASSGGLGTDTSGALTNVFCLHWNPAGTRLFIRDGATGTIKQYNHGGGAFSVGSINWGSPTATFTPPGASAAISAGATTQQNGFCWNDDGTILYYIDWDSTLGRWYIGKKVYSQAYDLSSFSFTNAGKPDPYWVEDNNLGSQTITWDFRMMTYYSHNDAHDHPFSGPPTYTDSASDRIIGSNNYPSDANSGTKLGNWGRIKIFAYTSTTSVVEVDHVDVRNNELETNWLAFISRFSWGTNGTWPTPGYQLPSNNSGIAPTGDGKGVAWAAADIVYQNQMAVTKCVQAHWYHNDAIPTYLYSRISRMQHNWITLYDVNRPASNGLSNSGNGRHGTYYNNDPNYMFLSGVLYDWNNVPYIAGDWSSMSANKISTYQLADPDYTVATRSGKEITTGMLVFDPLHDQARAESATQVQLFDKSYDSAFASTSGPIGGGGIWFPGYVLIPRRSHTVVSGGGNQTQLGWLKLPYTNRGPQHYGNHWEGVPQRIYRN